jgi:hypothetical protein
MIGACSIARLEDLQAVLSAVDSRAWECVHGQTGAQGVDHPGQVLALEPHLAAAVGAGVLDPDVKDVDEAGVGAFRPWSTPLTIFMMPSPVDLRPFFVLSTELLFWDVADHKISLS